ncbi:hypothetical protein HOH45_04320 [bacterium]|jgi:hypothetical protein|nr:hypothetical protein [bacterium]
MKLGKQLKKNRLVYGVYGLFCFGLFHFLSYFFDLYASLPSYGRLAFAFIISLSAVVLILRLQQKNIIRERQLLKDERTRIIKEQNKVINTESQLKKDDEHIINSKLTAANLNENALIFSTFNTYLIPRIKYENELSSQHTQQLPTLKNIKILRPTLQKSTYQPVVNYKLSKTVSEVIKFPPQFINFN